MLEIKHRCVIKNKNTGNMRVYYEEDKNNYILDEWDVIAEKPHAHELGKYSYMCDSAYCRCKS